MLRMKTLTQVVGNYHKAGLLHLDIKPENIYVRPQNETVEDVMLFDFDSVTAMKDIVASKALSCTKSWAAPEQLLPAKRKFICPATDLFAIGEIIFAQIFGRHSTNAERRSFVSKYSYDYDAAIFKDVNPKVFSILDELLSHTICGVVEKRYQTADELVEILEELIKIANPKEPYLKSSLPAVQNFFVGRENEIKEIHQKLSENNILFLNGIGGIGKSELAKNYALQYKDEYDVIIFAPYVSDVNMLLQDDNAIPLYNFAQYPEEKPEEYCTRKLRKLQELCDERILFIVDNLDREDDGDLNKLLNLGCKLLVTTRMDFSEYGYGQALNLDVLSARKKIRDIFDEYYTKELNQEEQECVESIIDFVAGHTMTVELLAKQMMAGRVKPDKMLAKLQEGGISKSGKEKVRVGKDGILSAQSAYAHIQTLFDLSELSEEEKYILANLSLIPHTGVDIELFYDWCELEDYDGINRLITEGWIRWNREKDYLSLHKVVGDIAINLLKQNPYLANALWINVYKSWHKLYNSNTVDKNRKGIMDILVYLAETAIRINIYTRQLARYLSSHLWVDDMVYYLEDSFNRIKRYYDKAIDICSNYILDGNFEKANAYGNLGLLYAYAGDDLLQAEKSIKYAISLLCEEGEEHIYKIAMFYDYLGQVVMLKPDLQNALESFDKAMAYFNKCVPIPHNKIGEVYNNIAGVYQDFDYFDLTEANYMKALKIFKEINGDEHSLTAVVYNNLGVFYEAVNKLEKAQECYLKALEIRMGLFGDMHSDTSDSFYGVASVYVKLKKYQDAKSYMFKALKIRKKIFGEKSKPVSNAYRILAYCYEGERWFFAAEKYYRYSLEIIREIYDENTADVALAYNNLGMFYRKQDRLEVAESFIIVATRIYESIFGQNNTNTAWSYFGLGLLYKSKGEYEKAETLIKKAYNVFKESMGEKHPKTVMIKSEIV